jgi:hypothetical protein
LPPSCLWVLGSVGTWKSGLAAALCGRTIGCRSRLGHMAVDAGDEQERLLMSLKSRGAMA